MLSSCYAAEPERGKIRKRSGTTAEHVGKDSEPCGMLNCRARTWLQLIGCALTLELVVLICGEVKNKRRLERDVTGQDCDGVMVAGVTERRAESQDRVKEGFINERV